MIADNLTYALINLLSVLFPLIFSFHPSFQFHKQWSRILPAILISLSIFIAWDILFSMAGIWKFNDQYIYGTRIGTLPVEEWVFFITIPYACLFIYFLVPDFVRLNNHRRFHVISMFFLIVGIANYSRAYTLTSFISAGILFSFLIERFPEKIKRFLLFYLIHLIPFSMVNGILTSLPVVIYNDYENLETRLGTIPVEDFIYSFSLMCINVILYESFSKKAIGIATSPVAGIPETSM